MISECLQDIVAMDTGSEDKENTNPAVKMEPITKPSILGGCVKIRYHYCFGGTYIIFSEIRY